MICVFSRYNISSLEGGEGNILRGEALITMLLGDDRRCDIGMKPVTFFWQRIGLGPWECVKWR